MSHSKLFNLVKSVTIKEYVDWSGETVRSYKQLTKDTQKSGGEGTQSGPSVDTSQNKQHFGQMSWPKKDAEPVQLQTRQKHDVEYKERNPEVDNPNLSAKSIFGLDPPSFITKKGKGPEKAVDPTTASGGRETKYADFSEKGQGKTTTSKTKQDNYVASPAVKDIFDKLDKQSASYEKMTSMTSPKTKVTTPSSTASVPKAITGKDIDKVKSDPMFSKKTSGLDNLQKTDAAYKQLKTKEIAAKAVSSMKAAPKETASVPKKETKNVSKITAAISKSGSKDMTPGEITRLSLGGPEFYKSKKASLKEFRILQEKIMSKK